MTTMQKFKAYFGMVPPSDYEDDYLEEPGAGQPRVPQRERQYRDEYYGDAPLREAPMRDVGLREPYREPEMGYADDRYGDDRFADDRYAYEPAYEAAVGYGGYDGPLESAREPEYAYAGGGRHLAEASDRMRPAGRLEPARLEPLQRSAGATLRAAGAPRAGAGSDQHELERVFADGPLHKITTLRPSDYGEARVIGERFRDGNPVIMDLVDMSNDDAKRLVDFAAGLAFALRGSFDKVATKVFLLSPADVDVSPDDRRKIAETGFYNHG